MTDEITNKLSEIVHAVSDSRIHPSVAVAEIEALFKPGVCVDCQHYHYALVEMRTRCFKHPVGIGPRFWNVTTCGCTDYEEIK
jgi:hypothetical protein